MKESCPAPPKLNNEATSEETVSSASASTYLGLAEEKHCEKASVGAEDGLVAMVVCLRAMNWSDECVRWRRLTALSLGLCPCL